MELFYPRLQALLQFKINVHIYNITGSIALIPEAKSEIKMEIEDLFRLMFVRNIIPYAEN